MFDWFDRYPTLREVIVNTRTGEAFRGALWRRRGDYLALRNAVLLKGKGETTPVDGEIVILSANVAWLQVLP